MNSIFLNPNDWVMLVNRLGLAILVGAVIGFNRQVNGKPAGFRTHILVSLGSALFVLIPLQGNPSTSLDTVSRTIQGVATGVGFLGAGEILHPAKNGQTIVMGLTSAASLWVTAALGMVAGCGLWQLSLLATFLTWLVLSVGKKLEKFLLGRQD